MCTLITYKKYDSGMIYYPVCDAADTLPGMRTSRQKALETAEDLLKGFGVCDIQLGLSKAAAGKTLSDIKEDGMDFSGIIDDPEGKKCYVFSFFRLVMTYRLPALSPVTAFRQMMSSSQYDIVWDAEEIKVMVDDSGVISFDCLIRRYYANTQ